MFFAASVISAILLGAFFILVWRYCVDRICPAQFWTTLYRTSHELLRVEDPARLLQIYRVLFGAVGRYLAGNLAGISIGLLPVVLLFYFALPAIDSIRAADTGIVAVYPGDAAELWHDNAPLPGHPGSDQTRYEIATAQGGELVMGDVHIPLQDFRRKSAVCWSYGYCALLEGFGFAIIDSAARHDDQAGFVLVRPDFSRYSLFWPYLNDIESLFMLVFLLTNSITFIILRRRAA